MILLKIFLSIWLTWKTSDGVKKLATLAILDEISIKVRQKSNDLSSKKYLESSYYQVMV